MTLKAFLRRYLMWIYLVLGVGLLVAYMANQIGPLYLATGSFSVVAILVGVYVNKPAQPLPWLLLAGGTILWVAGDFAWYSGGPDGPASYPSPTDVLYLLGYPVMAVCLALLLRAGNEGHSTAFLDAATITTGAGVLLWMRGLAPYFEGQSKTAATVSIAYLVLDLLLVGLAARLVLTRTRRTGASLLLSVGLLALVVADVASYLLSIDWDFYWTLLDAGWLISYLALGAAALHPAMARAVPKRPRLDRAPSVVSFYVLALGGLIAPMALLPDVIADGEIDLFGPLIGGVLFFGMAVIRMRGLVLRLEGANLALAIQGEQLKETEGLYRNLVEQSPAVSYILAFGESIEVRFVSPQVTEVLGFQPEELVGDVSLLMSAIHPDDRAQVFAPVHSDEHGRRSKTFRFLHKDGSVVWATSRISFVTKNADEQLWQGISFDISETRRIMELEEALQREKEAVAKLRALDEMKNTFLQAVSHELRTPLTSIKGIASTVTLRIEDLSKEDISDLVHRIEVNANRLEALLEDLLDVDRLSRGVFVAKQEDADVGAIVERVARSLEADADQRLTIDCDPVSIWTDASKVERIAENLISNAIKHTPPDCSIWVAVRPEVGGVQIVVEDSGHGISDDVKALIFEPFGQWESERSHSQGLGLGLSLVRRFAELLEGRAWVEDRIGSGASFNVFLPTLPMSMRSLEESAEAVPSS